jgi:murein DD-endopeptidase MepM/ murein hydrolase activator NlpD
VAVDGSLALDPRHHSLQGEASSVTVPPMPRASAHVRRRRAETAAARRKRRLAGLLLLASVALVTLLLTAFGSGRHAVVPTAAPAPATRLLPAGPPQPQVLALQGSIRLLQPVSRVTAIGYHASGDGALALRPVGRQMNQGLVGRVARSLFGTGRGKLRYYLLGGAGGPATSSLDVGSPVGTDVYSPVDGTVVGITPYIVDGRHMGARIDIQPSGNPSLVVSLTHLRSDPNLNVGSTLTATTSKVGSIIDFAGVERQALAKVTQDAGNHVAIEVLPATASLP